MSVNDNLVLENIYRSIDNSPEASRTAVNFLNGLFNESLPFQPTRAELKSDLQAAPILRAIYRDSQDPVIENAAYYALERLDGLLQQTQEPATSLKSKKVVAISTRVPAPGAVPGMIFGSAAADETVPSPSVTQRPDGAFDEAFEILLALSEFSALQRERAASLALRNEGENLRPQIVPMKKRLRTDDAA